jgi:hypothetical protein
MPGAAIAQERALVSETWQYGGTPDTIAVIGGGLGLLDLKTSPKPYPDHLVALAAHGVLREENNPQHPLASYHLICLPKDGSDFAHHAYADLGPQWELFKLWLAAYRLEKGLHDRQGREGRQHGRDKAGQSVPGRDDVPDLLAELRRMRFGDLDQHGTCP